MVNFNLLAADIIRSITLPKMVGTYSGSGLNWKNLQRCRKVITRLKPRHTLYTCPSV